MSIFDDAILHLNQAAKIVSIENEVIEELKHPKSILQVNIPVRMDDGSLKYFAGYRVKYNDSRGPAKGGIRFVPQLKLEETIALAFWMTIKTAVIGIPFGGSKGGIDVDPKALSHLELERLSRGYIMQIAEFIGPSTDIPAPDINTNAMIMGWMMHEYSSIVREHTPAVITGKPISMGGSLGRIDATGRGAYFCIKEFEKIIKSKNNSTKKPLTIAIQGFGNVGESIAKYLSLDENYKIVAISDAKGGIFSKNGLDIQRLIKMKQECKNEKSGYCNFSLSTITEYEKISNATLLALEVDMLIPAARENQITKTNAADVKAPYIFELANGPITLDADAILIKAQKHIIPDILANAGGVVVSYFEWVQNKAGYNWSINEVDDKLKEIMVSSFTKIFDLMNKHQIDMRTAAYAQALCKFQEIHCSGGSSRYFHNS